MSGERQRPPPKRIGGADDLVPYGEWLVPDWWAERVAICVESGASEDAAIRVANAERERRKRGER